MEDPGLNTLITATLDAVQAQEHERGQQLGNAIVSGKVVLSKATRVSLDVRSELHLPDWHWPEKGC